MIYNKIEKGSQSQFVHHQSDSRAQSVHYQSELQPQSPNRVKRGTTFFQNVSLASLLEIILLGITLANIIGPSETNVWYSFVFDFSVVKDNGRLLLLLYSIILSLIRSQGTTNDTILLHSLAINSIEILHHVCQIEHMYEFDLQLAGLILLRSILASTVAAISDGQHDKKAWPEYSSSLYSRITFSWISSFLLELKGNGNVKLESLWRTPRELSARNINNIETKVNKPL